MFDWGSSHTAWRMRDKVELVCTFSHSHTHTQHTAKARLNSPPARETVNFPSRDSNQSYYPSTPLAHSFLSRLSLSLSRRDDPSKHLLNKWYAFLLHFLCIYLQRTHHPLLYFVNGVFHFYFFFYKIIIFFFLSTNRLEQIKLCYFHVNES